MTKLALGVLVGAALYATATLLAFSPAAAEGPYRKASPATCRCVEGRP